MKRVKELFLTFALVTTGVLLAAAIFMTIFWQGEKVTGAILWQILSVAALCSLGNFIWPEREVSKKEWIVREFIHYFYVCVVVLGCGSRFEWFYWSNPRMVLLMLLAILMIFVVVMFVMMQMDKKTERQLNERLESFRLEREEAEKEAQE